MKRAIDNLGRVVIPKEIRCHYQLSEGTPVEFLPVAEGILLRKYIPERCLMNEVMRLVIALKENTPDNNQKKATEIQGHLMEVVELLEQMGVRMEVNKAGLEW